MATDHKLRTHHRHSDGKHHQDIEQQKSSATSGTGLKRESPDVAQPHGAPHGHSHYTHASHKLAATAFLVACAPLRASGAAPHICVFGFIHRLLFFYLFLFQIQMCTCKIMFAYKEITHFSSPYFLITA